ncbi:DUF4185 domain-containing protein [Flavivirga eckloniae]|uniref:DUF4185 domain-containing protein n=1 Tax=Flavivirga eckloniae TaxID=1803846 RepID=A0A2K9PVU4_9FLAO|nr:DUF4185 domain-containing protein [Flavivirga eckloniae]AUP80637.1 hypothetical protein C1H87_18735 [Flavivirga eckloniae]
MSYSGQYYLVSIMRVCISLVGICLFSCVEKKEEVKLVDHSEVEKEIEVTKAQVFNKLVVVDSLGVTGADGAISFLLTNGTSVFMMGDSFLKPVVDGKRDPKSKMINNTFIVVDKKNNRSTSIFKGTLNDPETMLLPKNNKGTKEYYWPGHGFEFNGELHIFMSRFKHISNDTWGFKYTGVDYLKLDKETFSIISQEDFPYALKNGVHYGHSIINEQDYTYIYGSKQVDDGATLHVARGVVDEATNTLTGYEFFNGKDWVKTPEESEQLKGIDKQVPEQFTVFKYSNKYILIMQERDLTSGNIYSYVSDLPTGPWKNKTFLYHTTEQETSKKDKLFTYNAMAHPQFIENDRLLVSYCTNSFLVPTIHENVDYYRPKFLWVPMKKILN